MKVNKSPKMAKITRIPKNITSKAHAGTFDVILLMRNVFFTKLCVNLKYAK